MALGYRRHGLLPHPAQVAVGEQVRRQIVAALSDVTDVVFSHFHGDHVPQGWRQACARGTVDTSAYQIYVSQ